MKLLGRKVLSYVIDYGLVILLAELYFFCADVFFLDKSTYNQAIIMLVCALITILLLTCYIPTHTKGQTIGQKIMKLKVTNRNGKKRTYLQSFIRECLVKITFGPVFILFTLLYFLAHLITKRDLSVEFPHDFVLKTKLITL